MRNRLLPGKCPVCGETMEVTRLHCPSCDSSLEGRFEMCRFCALTPEQKAFIEVFIKCRGNIKEVERELGISYPTVRGRLDAVIAALGYRVEDSPDESIGRRRREILASVQRGDISAEEAAKLLRKL